MYSLKILEIINKLPNLKQNSATYIFPIKILMIFNFKVKEQV